MEPTNGLQMSGTSLVSRVSEPGHIDRAGDSGHKHVDDTDEQFLAVEDDALAVC